MCFESIFIFLEMAAILNVGGHFGSYIKYYTSETFLNPNIHVTYVDNFIGLLQEIDLWKCLKKLFSIQWRLLP